MTVGAGSSDICTPRMSAQREFFEQFSTSQKPPQLMPVVVAVDNDDAKSSMAKGTESFPDFDKLPQIIEEQHFNRSQHFDAGQPSGNPPNDYQTFLFSMNQH